MAKKTATARKKRINWNRWSPVLTDAIEAFDMDTVLATCEKLRIRHSSRFDEVHYEKITAMSLLHDIMSVAKLMIQYTTDGNFTKACRPMHDVNMYLDDSGVLTAAIELTRDDVTVDPDIPCPDLIMDPEIQLKIYPNGGKEDNLVIVFIMASQCY